LFWRCIGHKLHHGNHATFFATNALIYIETKLIFGNFFVAFFFDFARIYGWIERLYNKNRIHSALGNKSITDFNNQNQTLAA
jgi:hypothetical protein